LGLNSCRKPPTLQRFRGERYDKPTNSRRASGSRLCVDGTRRLTPSCTAGRRHRVSSYVNKRRSCASVFFLPFELPRCDIKIFALFHAERSMSRFTSPWFSTALWALMFGIGCCWGWAVLARPADIPCDWCLNSYSTNQLATIIDNEGPPMRVCRECVPWAFDEQGPCTMVHHKNPDGSTTYRPRR